MTVSANKWRASFGIIALTALVLILAIDTGSRLLEPRNFASQLSTCTLSIMSGSVKVQSANSIAWMEASDGMRLEPGTLVRTQSDSQALLTFFDGTTTKLEPETDLAVVKLHGEAAQHAVLLKQLSGKTLSQVTTLENKTVHFGIETPSASAIVRGTVFLTEVEKSGRTIIKTERGQVDVAARGQVVQVSAGNETRVVRGKAPSAPVPTMASGNGPGATAGGTDVPFRAERIPGGVDDQESLRDRLMSYLVNRNYDKVALVGGAMLIMLLAVLYLRLLRWK